MEQKKGIRFTSKKKRKFPDVVSLFIVIELNRN